MFSCRPERGGRGLPRGSASPRPWHRSSSACHLTLGERNSSPPPWLAYVSPSHWGAYGRRTSPLARHLLWRPQHCTPLDFWAHGPVDASVHLLKWTGAFPGSGPGTSSRARLDFPGTTCRETSPGHLPGKPSSGPGTSSRARLPSLARLARDTCATFPGHALPGALRTVPLPLRTGQRAYPPLGSPHPGLLSVDQAREAILTLLHDHHLLVLSNSVLAHASRCLGTPGTRTSTIITLYLLLIKC